MAQTTNIQWCDSTWNPWRGCSKVSPGCLHCYAENLVTTRLGGEFGTGKPRKRASDATFREPLRWNRRPWLCDDCGRVSDNDGPCPCGGGPMRLRRVFLGSLMDWLDVEVPIGLFADALEIVRSCDQLEWITVTKRPGLWRDRMLDALNDRGCKWSTDPLAEWIHGWKCGSAIPANVTVLTSIENQEMADLRIPELLNIPGSLGLSLEPLLGPVDIKFHAPFALDWAIVGSEKLMPGNKAGRLPHNSEEGFWSEARSLLHQCRATGVPFFMKQGPVGGRITDDLAAFPEDLRIREFPKTTP